jgi:hypothetical protein
MFNDNTIPYYNNIIYTARPAAYTAIPQDQLLIPKYRKTSCLYRNTARPAAYTAIPQYRNTARPAAYTAIPQYRNTARPAAYTAIPQDQLLIPQYRKTNCLYRNTAIRQ